MPSPSRVRPTSLSGNSCVMPSILSFSMDVRRGKIGEDRIVETHLLRLLYNQQLQWRFLNARADATFSIQKLGAEKILWNAWIKISDLQHKVTLKRMKLLLLRQKLKLTSILKEQISCLDDWSLFLGQLKPWEQAPSVFQLLEKHWYVDIQNLKDSMRSAVDAMQGMASSIRSLSSKVKDYCLRTHILQLHRTGSSTGHCV
ncbi:hypothetical protein SAY86_022445 [Trapa natans]|uniref:Uncharacterized protein n=1 Tax=Trapa natans TaxID=22666 RepID=A0AAN7M939_TRANT|nr:hypothetical protein SAY86_022445 [Trapa natans]